MIEKALKELLIKIGDDQLILGYRNSEWLKFDPRLQKDSSFTSLALDKFNQSKSIFKLLNNLNISSTENFLSSRRANNFRNCQFVELPSAEHNFNLIRCFLFDTAEYFRFKILSRSSYRPLQDFSKKFIKEMEYHTKNTDSLVKLYGIKTDSNIENLQRSLDYAMPYALGIFEESLYESILIEENIFQGEIFLRELWIEHIDKILSKTELIQPDLADHSPYFGGRTGKHTEYLQPILDNLNKPATTK